MADPTLSPQRKLVIVAVDASAAADALIRGRVGGGASEAMQQVLVDIMDILAAHQLVLVALWIPRGLNTIADMLSHYSASLALAYTSGSCIESGFH